MLARLLSGPLVLHPLKSIVFPLPQEGGWYFFLHYNGWNKKYDEWVEAVGLVKAEEAIAMGALVSFVVLGRFLQ